MDWTFPGKISKFKEANTIEDIDAQREQRYEQLKSFVYKGE
jgi:hypothetical protein